MSEHCTSSKSIFEDNRDVDEAFEITDTQKRNLERRRYPEVYGVIERTEAQKIRDAWAKGEMEH